MRYQIYFDDKSNVLNIKKTKSKLGTFSKRRVAKKYLNKLLTEIYNHFCLTETELEELDTQKNINDFAEYVLK